MSTQATKKVGKLAKTSHKSVLPRKGVKVPLGTDPVPAAVPGQGPSAAVEAAAQGPATGTGPAGSTPPAGGVVTSGDPDVVAMLHACATIASCRETLGSRLVVLAAGQVARTGAVRKNAKDAIRAMAAILRAQPDLAPRVDPAALETAVEQITATENFVAVISNLLVLGKDTLRVTGTQPWQDARDAYHLASRAAVTDKELDSQLTPVRAMFQRAPRTATAPRLAADATRLAQKAAARAVKAQQVADAAHLRAAALAHAANPGTASPGGSPLPVPTPGNPAQYQGPATR